MRLALLFLCILSVCHLATAFYGVPVPAARATGPGAVPNQDCIYVYSCAPFSAGINDPSNQTAISAPLPASPLDTGVRPVYVGRAAGRCQRKMDHHKCAMVAAVVKENECRAAGWPDDDSAPQMADETFSVEACVVQQCHGRQIVLHFFSAAASSPTSLLSMQQRWISELQTAAVPPPVTGCNREMTVSNGSFSLSAVPVDEHPANVEWLVVASSVQVGQFGFEAERQQHNRTCSADACSAVSPAQLPLGFLPGNCNRTIPVGFSCQLGVAEGYTSLEPSRLICHSGAFTPQWPQIQESACPLPSIEGTTADSCPQPLPSRSSCVLQLLPSYAIVGGSLTITCTSGQLAPLPQIMCMHDSSARLEAFQLLAVPKNIESANPGFKFRELPMVDLASYHAAVVENQEMGPIHMADPFQAARDMIRTHVLTGTEDFTHYLLPFRYPLPDRSSRVLYCVVERHSLYLGQLWSVPIPPSSSSSAPPPPPSPVQLQRFSSNVPHASSIASWSALGLESNLGRYWNLNTGTAMPREDLRAGSQLCIIIMEALRFSVISSRMLTGLDPNSWHQQTNWNDFVPYVKNWKHGSEYWANFRPEDILKDGMKLSQIASGIALPHPDILLRVNKSNQNAKAKKADKKRPKKTQPIKGASEGGFCLDSSSTPASSSDGSCPSLDMQTAECTDTICFANPPAGSTCQCACHSRSRNPSSRRRLLHETEEEADPQRAALCDELFDLPETRDVWELPLPFSVVGTRTWLLDFDGDGLQDVLVSSPSAHTSSTCTTYLHSSFGLRHGTSDAFALPICFPHDLSQAALTLGDFDSDGAMDFLLRNATNLPCSPDQYAVVFGSRNGSFSDPLCVTSLRSNFTQSLFLSLDIDGDRRTDLVAHSISQAADPCPSHITVLHNQEHSEHEFYMSASCLVAEEPLPAEQSQLFIADFNGDYKDDIFFVCDDTADCGGCNAGFGGAFLSQGDGSFSRVTCFPHKLNRLPFPLPFAMGHVFALRDVNDDGLPDVVTSWATDECAQIGVFFTTLHTPAEREETDGSQPVLSWDTSTCSGPQPGTLDANIHVVDLNVDGRADLLVSHDHACRNDGSEGAAFWLAANNGTFSNLACLSESLADQSGVSFTGLLDWNGDGLPDIITQHATEEAGQLLFVADAILGRF